MFSRESRWRHYASTARKALLGFERLGPLAILALAALLRLWALGRPDSLVFDELYYVRDAVSQLAHGYPTAWPDNDPAFGGERARSFLDQASAVAHPPLGKWLIGLGIMLFGPDSGLGWRFSVAIAGVATVGVTMRIGLLLSRSMWVACLAGLLLALDGVHIVLSRVSLLDGFLTLFVSLGALFTVRDWLATGRAQSSAVLWRRPWLVAAGIAFGAAAAIKWSGLYPFAAFLVLVTVGDLLRRAGRERLERFRDRHTPRRHPLWGTVAQALVTAAIALPSAFLVYLASWVGWIVHPAGQVRHTGEPWWESLWRWHLDSFAWHSTLSAPHPYQSNPFGWPLALRPTAMFDQRADGYVSAITPLPNLLVTWGGVLSLLLLCLVVAHALVRVRRAGTLAPLRSRAVLVSAFVLTGYLSGWLPWVLTFSRSAVFQFYAVVMTPFAALALALALAAFASLDRNTWLFAGTRISFSPLPEAVFGRRLSVAFFLCITLVLAVLFWPVWAGVPIELWFYQLHAWLPGWA